MKEKKTTKEIVMQVADTYTLNSRSIEVCAESTVDLNDVQMYDALGSEACAYQTKDGNMCAVGMCMTKESLEEFGSFIGSVRDLHNTTMNQRNEQGLECLLKEEYRGHPLEFWSELQGLHDRNDFWDEDGLNERGKIQASKIIREFKNSKDER